MAIKYNIFSDIDEKSLRKVLNAINASKNSYKPNQTISYAIGNRNLIGIVEEGEAILIRYEYTGERTIIEELSGGDVFSDMFVSSDSSELSVVSKTSSLVTFFDYDELLNYAKNSKTALNLLNNLIQVISLKLIKRNERIELLTTRTIRNKLLAYFEMQAKKNNSKTFTLPYSYTDLADYLAIDRSALMRELKNLKDDKLVKDVNKKITIFY